MEDIERELNGKFCEENKLLEPKLDRVKCRKGNEKQGIHGSQSVS
jgi:hypothetical protein